MTKKINLLIILLLVLNSCTNYDDLEIVVKSKSISLADQKIQIALVGKEKLDGEIRIKFDEDIIGKGDIESHLDSEYKDYELNFNLIESDLSSVKNGNKISLNLVFINEQEKVKIDKKVTLKVKFPPISKIKKITGKNFESIEINESDLQTQLWKNKIRMIEPKQIAESKTILNSSNEIFVAVEVDTLFEKHIIGRFPVSENSIYDDENLEDILIKGLKESPEKIKSAYSEKLDNGNFIIKDTIKVSYSGNIGLYLINIDGNNNYFIQQIGILKGDDSSPVFNNRSWCSFNGDSEVQGQVCLDTKEFYGYNPHNVPFVGKAFGDISKIYIDKKSVPFKIGEEIYFKKRIYLDGGYNRISVKIVDKKGNITESFIPVTMERMNNTNIDIDNEINIDN